MARYWSINTAITAVPLSAHPSPIEVAAAQTRLHNYIILNHSHIYSQQKYEIDVIYELVMTVSFVVSSAFAKNSY